MIRRYNNISLALGVPGLALQLAGHFVQLYALIYLGVLLLMLGLAYYAKAKGRNPAWCLLGFLSIIGMIILAVLKDKAAEPTAAPAQPRGAAEISAEEGEA